MAGVKVTDLTTTVTAAVDDIFYIVDTSSNTSKQIEVQNIYSGLPQFDSGTFTPTVSNETFSEDVTPLAAYYSRVNDVVNCTYFLDVALDAVETEADFELSLPVPSNFSNVKDLVGIVAYDSAPADLIQWGLQAETVNNTAKVNLKNATMGNAFQYIYITVQYLVL